MKTIRSVTVYSASSRRVAPRYFEAASLLGHAIARQGWTLVYGGNDLGPMGALAGAARAAGGKVVGITPQLLVDKGCADEKCDELIVTPGMRERKALLEERGDAFIALPGGLGTLEELFEILVGRVLGYHSKPIVLLNIAGFYDPLISMIDQAITRQFAKPRIRQMFCIATSVNEAIKLLADVSQPETEPRPSAMSDS